MQRLDRTGRRTAWTRARVAEARYASNLKSVAKAIGVIVRGMAPGGAVGDLPGLMAALRNYATTVEPWARSAARVMLADVSTRDAALWRARSRVMSRALRDEIMHAPTGLLLRDLQAEQVRLIKSIPTAAAERVHEISVQAHIASIRPADVAKKILETENVSVSKAKLIARTEVSRAAANLVQARAEAAGSVEYVWWDMNDGNVRPSHKDMRRQRVRWDAPPTLDGLTGHAGCLPNCRCFAEPIFPDFD